MYTYMIENAGKNDELSTDELACIYAALILADDDVAITPDKISTLLSAANCTVENIWPSLYAKALAGINIRQYIAENFSAGGSGAAIGSGTAGSSGTAAGVTETKEEEKKPAPQEEDDDSEDDFGLGLFD